MRKILDSLFIILQYLVPQHWLSRAAGFVAECEWPWLKNNLITWFIGRYQVDMQEAADPEPFNYPTFNAFFTRALAADARPVAGAADAVTCPADGTVSQLGSIEDGRIFQAKGQDYSLVELLGGDEELAGPFDNGSFATIYLAPKDYHRVHMPLAGKLNTMVHVPGDLFSVNHTTAANVPRLFARNERVVCLFDTDVGPMAVVLIGAMIVASIETVWAGQVTPVKREIRTHHYRKRRRVLSLKKGEEMGRFKMGSTVVVLFGPQVVDWLQDYTAGSTTRMGEVLGTLRSDNA